MNMDVLNISKCDLNISVYNWLHKSTSAVQCDGYILQHRIIAFVDNKGPLFGDSVFIFCLTRISPSKREKREGESGVRDKGEGEREREGGRE